MSKKNNHRTLLPWAVIEAAIEGDPLAVGAVLRHYEGYISKLSMRHLFDEDGNSYYCVDEELRRRLEVKLISAVLSFPAA